MNTKQNQLINSLKGWKFRLYLLKNLPMGFLAGLRIDTISADSCVTSVPFNWLTKNPFKSMYFAVQSMAAELSTATTCLVATMGAKPSIAYIIVTCNAKFIKKATSRVSFTCENAHEAFDAVKYCLDHNEAITKTFRTIGRQEDDTIVSEFEFTWSFKARKS